MRRFHLLAVAALACCLVLGSCGSARRAQKLQRKIRIEKIESLTPHGLTGVDAVVSVSNSTRHNITLEAARLTLKYDGAAVAMLQLRDPMTLPKRFSGELELSGRLKIYDPLGAMSVLGRIKRGETDRMTVTLDATARAGVIRKNILYEDVQLDRFLATFAVSIDRIGDYLSF